MKVAIMCRYWAAAVVMATVGAAAVVDVDKGFTGRLETLERQQSVNEAELQRMAKFSSEQSQFIQELRAENIEQEETIASLTEQVKKTEADIASSTQRVLMKCAKFTNADSTNTTDQKDFESAYESSRVKRQSGVRLGFTAYIDRQLNPSTTEIVKFDKVISNIGTGYNSNTGMFTANEIGLYLFTFTISQAGLNQYIWVDLLVNGVKQLEAVAETYHSGQYIMGTNTLVKYLQRGDMVWVATRTATQLAGDRNHITTSFTGVFLS